MLPLSILALACRAQPDDTNGAHHILYAQEALATLLPERHMYGWPALLNLCVPTGLHLWSIK
jgi:hypothetical protein